MHMTLGEKHFLDQKVNVCTLRIATERHADCSCWKPGAAARYCALPIPVGISMLLHAQRCVFIAYIAVARDKISKSS